MMRYQSVFAILILSTGGLAIGSEADVPAQGPRDATEIRTGWRFQVDPRDLGERDHWFAAAFDRSGWREAEVPRAWDVLDKALWGYEGVGWYSVTLDGSWARAGKIQHLTFGRVMYHAKVWLNGEHLGEHIGGYLPFAFDVTGKLDRSVNQIVIRVDNRPQIDWLPAAKQIEWVQYGGILQPVRVESHGLIFLSDLAIRAAPAGEGASVACTAELNTRQGADATGVAFKIAVFGAQEVERGAPLANTAVPSTRAEAGSSHQEAKLTLAHATAWSPDSPAIYLLVATLERDGKEIDRLESKFGVRTIAASGRQLLLNGRVLKIKGVNRYDEFGRFGPNPPQALVVDELRLMKKTGINLIRSHYPQTPEFLDLCDRLGILFLEELPINWWGVEWFGKEGLVQNEQILDRAIPMLETMIRRDRNHPSIILWSMANESKTDNAIGIKVMRALIRRTKDLDATRLVTFVTNPGSVSDHRAFEDADLVATNMYHGSLSGPLVERRNQLDERARRPTEEHLRRELEAFPDKPLLITEFGAMGMHSLHGDAPNTEEFQADYLRAIWAAISSVPEVSGGVVWSWADYNHRRAFTSLGPFGSFGAVTIDRKPKAALNALAAMFGDESTKP
jgi:beta-galactosidase/beta-glucuronidase